MQPMTHRATQLVSPRLSAWACTAAAAILVAALAGCAYGMPPASPVDRPTIPAGATPVYSWTVSNHEVMYYWYKVAGHYVDIKARGYFPTNWNSDADAVWEITLKSREGDGVPGTYVGILRTYTDASGSKRREIIPPVPPDVMANLHEGMYAVVENGVETEPDNPHKIKAIRPVVHIYMARDDHMFNPFYDHKINLTPDLPSDITPLPPGGGAGEGAQGTPLNVMEPAPAGQPGATNPDAPKDHVDPVTGVPGNNP